MTPPNAPRLHPVALPELEDDLGIFVLDIFAAERARVRAEQPPMGLGLVFPAPAAGLDANGADLGELKNLPAAADGDGSSTTGSDGDGASDHKPPNWRSPTKLEIRMRERAPYAADLLAWLVLLSCHALPLLWLASHAAILVHFVMMSIYEFGHVHIHQDFLSLVQVDGGLILDNAYDQLSIIGHHLKIIFYGIFELVLRPM